MSVTGRAQKSSMSPSAISRNSHRPIQAQWDDLLLRVSSIALLLLSTACIDSELSFVAGGIGCVGTLIVLNVARTREGVGQVVESRVAFDLELCA